MLPDIQANPDYQDHPVFLWNPSGGAIVSPLEADFCAQTGLSVEEAYGAAPQPPSQPTTSPTLSPIANPEATSPDTAGEDMVVYEPLGQDEESLEDDSTINVLAQPCQPSHID